ncbi:MAG: hypothetical protein HY909_26375 [Deltaproteobacteria bacterium]|nr:hypothetical protein [Deltaproteobacteria bacterium]
MLVADYFRDGEEGLTEVVVGTELDREELDCDVEAGLWQAIPETRVPSGHRLVRGDAGRWEVVPRDALERRRRAMLRERLALAGTIARRPAQARRGLGAALDAAWDVEPRLLLTNVLRSGHWRTPVALEALLSVEPDPSRFGRVRSHSLWGELRLERWGERLLAAAQQEADADLSPEFALVPPVPEEAMLRAVALRHLRRRWGLEQPVELAHDDLAAALRGDLAALDRVGEALRDVRAWRVWSELIALAPERARAELGRAFGDVAMAPGPERIGDLLGVARSWYTLEENMDERSDRLSTWRRALSAMAGWIPRGGTPWRQGELLAGAVRERLLPREGALLSLREEFEQRCGVRLDSDAFMSAEGSVVGVVPRRAPPCVFSDRRTHRDALAVRFGAAHALAHLLLEGGTAREEGWSCTLGSDPGTDDRERMANAFAAYLLAPRKEVQMLVQRAVEPTSEEFVRGAMAVRGRFGLSAVAAGEHMVNCLGGTEGREPLSSEVRGRLREAASRERVGCGAGDVLPELHHATGRSEAFVRAVERCEALGAITPEQRRRVLGDVVQ